MAEQMRLDKFLAQAGCGTRSQVKNFLKAGRVTVNGAAAKKPEIKISETEDLVCLDGKEIHLSRFGYFMMNKPAGVLSATEDSRQKTVLDLLPENPYRDLFPVGRLDKDTTGLLLICNDGKLAHELLSPKKHVDKVYLVRTDRPVEETAVRRFAEGIRISEDFQALPARLEILEPCQSRVTIQEGKFHQVKRMFSALGLQVTELKRISMGPLCLDGSLALGESRELTEKEVEALKQAGKTG